jgi:arsenate reductase (glutaredoxin)
MPGVTIYYNPDCGNCRQALALIREKGIEPHVVEYMKQPLSRETLEGLLRAMGLPARDLLRAKDPLYEAKGLADPKWSDDELVGLMVAHPGLINRPIVATPVATRLCRPPSTVLDILR